MMTKSSVLPTMPTHALPLSLYTRTLPCVDVSNSTIIAIKLSSLDSNRSGRSDQLMTEQFFPACRVISFVTKEARHSYFILAYLKKCIIRGRLFYIKRSHGIDGWLRCSTPAGLKLATCVGASRSSTDVLRMIPELYNIRQTCLCKNRRRSTIPHALECFGLLRNIS